MNLDGTNINFFVAFIAGVFTFFASCLLPLVPTYLAFLAGHTGKSESNIGNYSGTSNNQNTKSQKHKDEDNKSEILLAGLFFTLGFIAIFTLLGITANTLGNAFAVHRTTIQRVGGVFFILLGLLLLEVIKPISILKERKIDVTKHLTKWKKVNALLVGITFGFAWTPCIFTYIIQVQTYEVNVFF